MGAAIASQSAHTPPSSAFAQAAKAGPDYPRFLEKDPIGSTRMLQLIRGRAYNMSAYVATPEPFLDLVRSGKMFELSHALPVSISQREDLSRRSSGAGNLSELFGSGSRMPPSRDLSSMSEFTRALHGTILPALEDQPLARADWMTLATTMAEIEIKIGGVEGWKTAYEYMQRTLTNCIARREEFGSVNLNDLSTLIVESMALKAAHPQQRGGSSSAFTSNNGGGGGCGSGRNRGSARSDGRGASVAKRVCFDWNSGSCKRGSSCNYPHACNKCGGASHTGAKCTVSKEGAAGASVDPNPLAPATKKKDK